MAGYTIGIRIIVFALLPPWGLSNAAATMAGRTWREEAERAERAVWIAGLLQHDLSRIGGAMFFLFARPILSVFTADPLVTRHGVDCLRIVSYGFIFYAYGMVLEQAFNGAGDTWTPAYLNLFCFWLWEIPIAYWLARSMGLGPRGVFIAITIAFSTLAVVSAVVFAGDLETRVV